MRAGKYGFGSGLFLILTVFTLLLAGARFSLPVSAEGFAAGISGATGWGTTSVSISQEDMSYLGEIPAKEPFRILGEYNDDLLQVEYNGMTGYVSKNNVLINLPDVEPGILYNLTNATGSVFTSTTERGTANLRLSLFGSQLYYNDNTADYYNGSAAESRAGKVWDEKLGRYEFVVPILYSAAEKIAAAREMAAADGYNFKIYDAYRPNVATRLMSSSFNSLYSQTGGGLQLGDYDTGFFVASALSAHNIGCAIDVTMVWGLQEVEMPTKMHVLSVDAVLFNSSAGAKMAKELYGRPYSYYEDNFADTMTEEAKLMCWYMINAGMTGLGTEWWHFQDQSAYNQNSGYYTNIASWYPCRLYAPADEGEIPEVYMTRGEAAYQLWAAAGFPAAPGEISFSDVTEYDYYYNAVKWAVSAGLISGSSTATFSPHDAITRAGFLNMFYRYCSSPSQDGSEASVFDDVNPNAWYYSAVQWAAKTGITEETSGSFRPTGVLTHRQLHEILTRASQAGIRLSANYI